MNQLSRNASCPCGSGKKYKKCCANTQLHPANTKQDLIEYAFSLFDRGNLTEAQQACKSIILTEPQNADALHLLGLINYQQGFTEKAKTLFSSAVKIQPNNPWIQNNLAMILITMNKLSDASKHAKKAIQLMPELETAHNNLGLIYRKTNNNGKAEKAFMQAVKLNPNDPSFLCNLGEVFVKNKKYELAGDSFTKAIQIMPNYIPALNNQGLLLKETKKHQSALEIFQQLLTLEPNDPDIINNIGTVYISLGDNERAKIYFEKAIQIHPLYFGAYINLGNLYLGENSFEKSGEYYIQALEINPNNIEAIEAYLTCLIQQEEWNSAEFYLHKILPDFPKEAYLHCVNAEIYLRKEQKSNAIKEALLAVKLQPSYTHAYVTLGKIYQHFGMEKNSRETYQQGIINETNKSQLYLEWAIFEERNHNYDKAITLGEKALEIDSENENNIRLLFSSIARHNMELDVAIKELEKVEIDTEKSSNINKNFLFEKGSVFDKAGRFDDAFNCFTKASVIRGELQNRDFNPEDYKNKIKNEISSLSPNKLNNLPVCKATDSKLNQSPIFIVGFPRSGTTLIEQILCSHPNIAAGGELTYISQIKSGITNDFKDNFGFPEALLNMNDTEVQNILSKWRSYYFQEIEKLEITGRNKKVNQFTDKMPLNVLNLPLISMLFPDAPIIHIIRNPMDVCLSAFFTDFSTEHYWTNKIEHTAYFYNQTSKLIEHYKKNLHMNYFEVQYENLIKDQELWSRKVIEFVGESWDEKCLQFNKTKRIARTASYAQVNKKIYTSSVSRYKNYEKHLSTPLKMLKPIMQRYGYI